ncbi:MAG: hypothetical protein LBF17_05325, partial [Mediterranea sp.]|nr:hypothetical protein [Mediterranea sp.]
MPGHALFAQQKESGDNSACTAKHVCRFAYPLGKSDIHLELGNNAEVLSLLNSFIRSAITDSRMRICRIRLAGYCSIEGSYAVNERLAYDRVDSFRGYLRATYPELYRYPVDVVWVSEDWEGLSRLVRESELEEKEEALDIMRCIRSFDTREFLLTKLNGGRAYWYMERYFFDQLRRVEIEIEYDMTQAQARAQAQVQVPGEKADPLIYNVLENT